MSESVDGYGDFTPYEVGYQEMVIMFDKVKHEGNNVVVVNSDDMLSDPEKVLERYCEQVDLAFESSMLKWQPMQPEYLSQWATWDGWHKQAIESTGIDKPHTTVTKKTDPTDGLPIEAK